MDWSGVDYLWIIVIIIFIFLSTLDSPSDGIHSLQRIHLYNAKFLQIYSDEETA